MLALHIGRTGRDSKASRRLRFGRIRITMILAVVDDDAQTRSELFQPRYHVGFVEIIGHHTDLGLLVGDGLVEHLQDRTARFEAHPCQSFICLRMGWNEGQSVDSLGREQCGDVACRLVSVHECLRRYEPASEGKVEHPGIRLAPELNGHLL